MTTETQPQPPVRQVVVAIKSSTICAKAVLGILAGISITMIVGYLIMLPEINATAYANGTSQLQTTGAAVYLLLNSGISTISIIGIVSIDKLRRECLEAKLQATH